jgi:superfamily II DNA/RNA helicase
MNVFDLRDRLVGDYSDFVRSFIHIQDDRIREAVQAELQGGLLWPDPLIQVNPSFEPGDWIDELVDQGVLHDECRRVFRIKPEQSSLGQPLRLHRHQSEAVRTARAAHNYVLTTGTGSGKSLAYIIPIVDHVLRTGSGRGIQAIIVYPMNALANSQRGELTKFLAHGYPQGHTPVTFARYTGQESQADREQLWHSPPDILLTNYVMLELILTRPFDAPLVRAAKGLRFLVLDELHTYRGRQGADVAMLVRRTREAMSTQNLQCIGTSATIAATGTFEEQRSQVASVATRLFGGEVRPQSVVGETLRRVTPERDIGAPEFLLALRQRLESEAAAPTKYQPYIEDPLSIWIETVLGPTTEPGTGRLIRSKPRSVTGPNGVALELSALCGVREDRCVGAIRRQLLGSYSGEKHPETGFPVFAFRLHQFISRGDTVYATAEPEPNRHITLHGQQFVPGDRSRSLLPLVFCRECGQEYYCVRLESEADDGQTNQFVPRQLSDRLPEEGTSPGFLYLSTRLPWPDDPAAQILRLPDTWLEESPRGTRVRSDRRKALPRRVVVLPSGAEGQAGTPCYFVPAPFRFCLACGVAYDMRQSSDFGKLTSLGTEGRSTATTVLSLSAIRYLRADELLAPRARKLLSFTDNRQDASLQAGHFNDFVEIGLLRSALYRAVQAAGPGGIKHEELAARVFDALTLPLELYAADAQVRYQALDDTTRALRMILGYRIYRDLKRGWRVTSPNLEQCGLLEIQYSSLRELCSTQTDWASCHQVLASASPTTREVVARTLLDVMRRELAIKVDVLQEEPQERMRQLSFQRLTDPWAIDENEVLERATVLYPRSRAQADYRGDYYLSPRGGFGQYLRRSTTFPTWDGQLNVGDTQVVCRELLEALRVAGLVERVVEPRGDDVPGYQIVASSMLWTAGDGSRAFHDPIRVPGLPQVGARTNPFFIGYYRDIARDGAGLEAREHTAQVPAAVREERELRFRDGRLPVLYCSPTMELGVDIAELNTVNMRNVPPTPANYAQRSGRAGRGGQPALVFTYCSGYSPHDQYFFRKPDRMVGGSVTPQRLELGNQDLVRAHVHSLWLAASGLFLGNSLIDVLDVGGTESSLALRAHIKEAVDREEPRRSAKGQAMNVLASIHEDLSVADWYSEGWLDEVLNQVAISFDRACDRWRDLYRAAAGQQALQNRITLDNSRTIADRDKAKRLRAEAEAQIRLLEGAEKSFESDFYSYRYFASEGFLPGYNFPRLPLSAFIPGRRGAAGRDEYLSRPRFLAISEFGPRAIVYHEGVRYRINRVILPVDQMNEESGRLVMGRAKQCVSCGYLHPCGPASDPDLCERCQEPLPAPMTPLFRLQNVSTRRTDRINSDEEERLRLGFELKTGIRFVERGGRQSVRTAKAIVDGQQLAALDYGDAADIWRINLGWTRRANKGQLGFVLDLERGYWQNNQLDDNDPDDPMTERTERVIPYVQDHRNCLLLALEGQRSETVMASIQAALKNAIQVEFQVEDQELAVEPLPSRVDRRVILFYEASEGGAGVLRRLVDDADSLRRVARRALLLCHFDPDDGRDLDRAPGARERCEAACYDCLMSYSNQPDHRVLDRHAVRDLLLQLAQSDVHVSPTEAPRAEHLQGLLNASGSELERRWLHFIEEYGLRLPTAAQRFMEACRTRPDFVYDGYRTAVYVDGPPHEFPDRQARDEQQSGCLEDAGWTILRFNAQDDWRRLITAHPNVFGVRGRP